MLTGMAWRTLSHTADIGLEVEAESWPALLVEATRAFAQWLTGGRLDGVPHETERPIAVHGADRVETWVGYWRALHRLWTVEGFLPYHATLGTSPEGTSVTGTVGCVSAGALDPAHCADVKAVTWHAARVEERKGRWIGSIVLDL